MILDMMLLNERAMQAMLEEKPGLVAVPIFFYNDLDAYNHYKLPLAVQGKVSKHYETAASNP